MTDKPDTTIYDTLMCLLDDNKYEGHEGTQWTCNWPTYMHIRKDVHLRGEYKDDLKYYVLGLPFIVNKSLPDGEVNLIN